MTQNILVIGATSAIAQQVARRYAETGAHLFLAARSAGHLEAVAADLQDRGAAAPGTRSASCTWRWWHLAHCQIRNVRPRIPNT
jgi:NAD(P)-dependent dehydrogenase (short-subunit alcohol dehydrogenase family)